jgi:cytochrome c oxidase subunit 4
MASEAEHHDEQHGLQPMQYIQIGIVLTIITVVELAASLWVDLGDALIPVLFVLSAVKFGAVISLFMHLRFDNIVFTRIFLVSLALGTAVLIALISLFWSDVTVIEPVTGIVGG